MNEQVMPSWRESLSDTYQEFASQIISSAPQIIGAVALLFVGWAVSFFLKIATKKLIIGFDFLFLRSTKPEKIKKDSIINSYATLISKMVFWVVMIFFITAAAHLLDWNYFSNWMSKIINYLPNLIAGLLIILAGFVIGNVAKIGVLNASQSAGLNQGAVLARTAYITVVITSMVVGTEQLGINVNFITDVIVVIIGVVLAGGVFAFSLGAKSMMANIIGVQQVRKHCRIGEFIQIGKDEGTIAEVTQTSIVLETDSGRTLIPAKSFLEESSRISSPSSGTSGDENKAAPQGVDQ